MANQILIPHGVLGIIEGKLISLKAPASRPTIRRALAGLTPKKSKQKEYKLIRAIALENGGAEINK